MPFSTCCLETKRRLQASLSNSAFDRVVFVTNSRLLTHFNTSCVACPWDQPHTPNADEWDPSTVGSASVRVRSVGSKRSQRSLCLANPALTAACLWFHGKKAQRPRGGDVLGAFCRVFHRLLPESGCDALAPERRQALLQGVLRRGNVCGVEEPAARLVECSCVLMLLPDKWIDRSAVLFLFLGRAFARHVSVFSALVAAHTATAPRALTRQMSWSPAAVAARRGTVLGEMALASAVVTRWQLAALLRQVPVRAASHTHYHIMPWRVSCRGCSLSVSDSTVYKVSGRGPAHRSQKLSVGAGWWCSGGGPISASLVGASCVL